MKKYWWITLVLVFALAIPAAAAQVIKIYVNGAELKSDVPAQIINGRTMVPIRAIAENFGKKVDWNESKRTVTITGKTNLELVSTISKEWAAAGHAIMKEPLAYAGPRDACQPCHSGNGIQRLGSTDPYKPGKGILSNPLATNKTWDPEGKYAANTFMFDPHTAELPSAIDCAACHTGAGAAIMKSGVVPGSANVFSPGTDWKVGKAEALCFTCHNGRRNVKGIYQKWATPGAAKENAYPHHAWGALVTGLGGMEYPDIKYPQSTTHQSIGCIGCHMAKTKDGYVSHTFKPVIATCNKCHPGQTEFTMDGKLKKELEEKAATLEKLVLAKIPGAVRIGISYSDSPAVDKDGKRIDSKDIPLEALVGAYNWTLIHQELTMGGKGVHNPQYAKALLNESIKKLQ
jgi:hypothetical protein